MDKPSYMQILMWRQSISSFCLHPPLHILAFHIRECCTACLFSIFFYSILHICILAYFTCLHKPRQHCLCSIFSIPLFVFYFMDVLVPDLGNRALRTRIFLIVWEFWNFVLKLVSITLSHDLYWSTQAKRHLNPWSKVMTIFLAPNFIGSK